ncbi:MAG: hypothetical protein LBU34_10215 [Planctomycetaceae bacterium]|nr:hypothetical protein [Planctomycetaceae bacterium]
MCKTAGSSPPSSPKSRRDEIINQHNHNLALAGLMFFGGWGPEVALRFTAGYAHLVPCGTKTFASGFPNGMVKFRLRTI